MASFDGYIADEALLSEQQRGHISRTVENPFKRFNAWYVSTERPYSGSAALKLFPGGVFTLDVAVDSGSRTLRLQAWVPINGAMRIDIADPDTGEIIQSDVSTGDEAWEELSVSWTATAQVYLLYIRHMGSTQMVEGTDPCCYADAIEVV